MLIKCPNCMKVVSIRQDDEGGLRCSCGKDLSEYLERSNSPQARTMARLRKAGRDGFVGGMLGLACTTLITFRFQNVIIPQFGPAGFWLALASGPVVGFLLAAVLGDLLLNPLDDMLG